MRRVGRRLASQLLQLSEHGGCLGQQLRASTADGCWLLAAPAAGSLLPSQQQHQQQHPLHTSIAASGSRYRPQEVLVTEYTRKSDIYNKDNFQRFEGSGWSYEEGVRIVRQQDAAKAQRLRGHLQQLVRDAVDVDGLRSIHSHYGNVLQQMPGLCAAVIIKASQVATNVAASRKAERLVDRLLPSLLAVADSAAPNDMANVLWALSRLRYTLVPEQLQVLQQLLLADGAAVVQQLDERSLGKLALAAQTLFRDEEQLWAAVEQQVVAHLEQQVAAGSSSSGSSSSVEGSHSSSLAVGKEQQAPPEALTGSQQQLQRQQQPRASALAVTAAWALAKAGRAPVAVQELLQKWLGLQGTAATLSSNDVASLWHAVATWHLQSKQQAKRQGQQPQAAGGSQEGVSGDSDAAASSRAAGQPSTPDLLCAATASVLPDCTVSQLSVVLWAIGSMGLVDKRLLTALSGQLGNSHEQGLLTPWAYTTAWRSAVSLGPAAAGLLLPTAKAVCAQPEAFTATELTHILATTPRVAPMQLRQLVGLCQEPAPVKKSRRRKTPEQLRQEEQQRQQMEAAAEVPPWCTAIAQQVARHVEGFSPSQLAACVQAWSRLQVAVHEEMFSAVAVFAQQHPLAFSPVEAATVAKAFAALQFAAGKQAVDALLNTHSSSPQQAALLSSRQQLAGGQQ